MHNRGEGNWKIATYNPQGFVGPAEGVLVVGKDFHTVYHDDSMTECLVSVPSQNVAFVVNAAYLEEGTHF